MSNQKLTMTASLMLKAAKKRGIECEILDEDTIKMTRGNKWWYTRGSKSSFQSSVGDSIALRKDLSKIVFNHFHIPTARHIVIKNKSDVFLLRKLIFPLVMKPFNGSEGAGVIIGIKNLDQAKNCLSKIQIDSSNYVLFEETLIGNEYRILCIDHKFVAANHRKAAHVTGNGEKTIKELIIEKNLHPWRGEKQTKPLSKILIDELVIDYLKEQNLTINSIPKKNQEVSLRKTANISTGGESWNVTDQACKENIELFEKISSICDLDTVGIDVMCNSLEIPIAQQKSGGIIEVNAAPYLRMHHYPLKGKPIDTASIILDMIEIKYEVANYRRQ
ncbi:MAG: hypothetical protein ABFQ62_00545 [Patescibacteria group bacterium]